MASELEAELAQTRTSMRAAAAAHQEEVRALKAQVVVANSAKEEAGRQLAQTQVGPGGEVAVFLQISTALVSGVHNFGV